VELTDFFSGLTYSPDNIVENNGTLVLRSSNIKAGEVTDADNVYVDSAVVNCDNVQIGDVIVVVRNGSRSLIGKHGQVKVEMPNTVIGAFMTGLRSPQATYVNTLLDTKQFDLEITKNLGATINQITTGAFKQMTFSVSKNDEEQTAIGTFFRTLDNIIAIYKRKLDGLRELKKAYLQQMFPQAGEVVPRVRFKGFTAPWHIKKVSELVTLTVREIPKPTESYKRISVRSHAKGTFHQIVEDPSKIAMDNVYVVHENDLIVNITFAWEHAIAVASKQDHGLLVSHRFPTYEINKSDINFLRFLITQEGFRRKLELISPGGAGRNRVLNKNDFADLELIVPCANEQTIIGMFFNMLDKNITAQSNKVELLKQLKLAYLQKMFV